MEDSDISEMLDEWNVDFKDKGSGKGEQRHFTHMLLSANVDTTEVNYQKVLDTARQTAWQQFGQLGYEYKLVLHRDTDNPHVHIVLNNYNKVTNKKLRLDRHDLFTIRSSFADNLSKIRPSLPSISIRPSSRSTRYSTNFPSDFLLLPYEIILKTACGATE
jgi:hypothetical protein